MMDFIANQSPEQRLVHRLIQVSTQLQREEGFMTIEEQDLARELGINWFQAVTFKQALSSVDMYIKDNKSNPTKERALVKSLKCLLSELLPTLFALRIGDEVDEYMPDENALLERLRHHYVLELIYQDQYAASKSMKSGNSNNLNLSQNAVSAELWLVHLDSAIRMVYDDLGMDKAFVQSLINGNLRHLFEDQNISIVDKKSLSRFEKAIKETRHDLQEDYTKKASHVRPSQLSALIPSVSEIVPLIHAHIHKAYLKEEAEASTAALYQNQYQEHPFYNADRYPPSMRPAVEAGRNRSQSVNDDVDSFFSGFDSKSERR